MKHKSLYILAALVFAVIAVAFQQKEKTYTFILNAQQTNALFYSLQKTSAEYNVVGPLLNDLNQQLQPQIDTVKSKK